MKLVFPRPLEGKSRFFELCHFWYLAPLKHCADAIQLWEEMFKVLGQLSWTFSSVKHDCVCAGYGQSLRVLSWPLYYWRNSPLGLEDLLLMFWSYIMLVHVVRNRLVLIFLKSVPLLISYDVICVKILHLNNFARF